MKKAFANGTIHSRLLEGNTLLIDDGKVTAVGEDLPLEGYEVTDLKGAHVYPGLTDSHMHLVNCGYTRSLVSLFDVTDIEDLARPIYAYIEEKSLEPGDWIRGRGWNNDNFHGKKEYPTRYDLDRIAGDYPMVLTRVCGHVAVCNSAVLKILGMEKSAPYVEGGAIDTDERGVPNGIFREEALEVLYPAIPAPSLSEVKAMIVETLREMNSYGLTGGETDDFRNLPGCDWQLVMDAYRELEEEGLLTLRVVEQANFPFIEGFEDFLAAEHTTGSGTDLFKIGPLKMLLDGALGARTAALRQEYADDPGNYGILTMKEETLEKWLTLAKDHGMNAAIHCIGDRAMEVAMKAFKKVYGEKNKEMRNGLVHCQITDREILEDMAAENILAFVQPIFLDYDHRIVRERVGEDLEMSSYAWKTMKDLGIHTSYGTDAPVEPFQPFHNMYEAVARKTLEGNPEGGWNIKEAVSVAEALEAYTYESAYAAFAEEEWGSLTPGQWADFMVVPRDLEEVSLEEFRDTVVLATYLAGKRVF